MQLIAHESAGLHHASGRIGHGQLEDELCQINGNSCSIHVGFFSFDEGLIPTPVKTSFTSATARSNLKRPIWLEQLKSLFS